VRGLNMAKGKAFLICLFLTLFVLGIHHDNYNVVTVVAGLIGMYCAVYMVLG
jgi:nicotinamide riboside transporter PnuC